MSRGKIVRRRERKGNGQEMKGVGDRDKEG